MDNLFLRILVGVLAVACSYIVSKQMISASDSGKVTMVEWENEWGRLMRNMSIHRTLKDIQLSGNRALYDACDVTNEKSVSKVISAVSDEFGTITGIIHGAGMEDSKLLGDKSWETFSKVVSVKIDGWRSIIDAIGDMVVVLTNLAHLNNVNIETCIASAYNEIKNRKGKMINGTFVKTDGLSEAEITLLMDGHGN